MTPTGVGAGLVRFSIEPESGPSLPADLAAALDAAGPVRRRTRVHLTAPPRS